MDGREFQEAGERCREEIKGEQKRKDKDKEKKKKGPKHRGLCQRKAACFELTGAEPTKLADEYQTAGPSVAIR